MDTSQFERISKALADPTRFAMLERIAAVDQIACMDLAEHCSVTPATTSHHLKELVSAGLIDARREAKFMIHTLRRDVWRGYLTELELRIPRRD
ncbi:MAG: helix-turn-helix transcriptional regulator [Bryobacterales bacterium]|nr:helix-turn-helix transcriptional regulator [Bryobacterales bacterium]